MATLTERADAIIMQDAHTDEDIIELQKIKWKMTLAYRKQAGLAGAKEDGYNRYRSQRYIERKEGNVIRENGKQFTDKDADTYSKNEAETHKQRGGYRETNGDTRGMRATIESIDSFCIAYYRKDKNEQSASMTT